MATNQYAYDPNKTLLGFNGQSMTAPQYSTAMGGATAPPGYSSANGLSGSPPGGFEGANWTGLPGSGNLANPGGMAAAGGTPAPQTTISNTPYGYVGNVGTDRLQTSASGGTYIGGMTPQLGQANLSGMWGSTAENPGYTAADLASAQATLANRKPYVPPTSTPSGGSSGGGMSGGGTPSRTSNNPYLSGAAGNIGRQTNDAVNSWLNQIQGNSVGNGTLGGSRQGVAQAMALSRGADALSGNLANMYSNDWNQNENRGLQQYGMDQNFYSSQRGQDLAAIGLGSQIETQNLQNQWMPYLNASNIYSNLSGNSGTTTNGSNSGTDWSKIAGGLMSGAVFGKNMGWL